MIESSEKIQDIYEELDNADRINYLIKQVFVLFMYLYFRFVQSEVVSTNQYLMCITNISYCESLQN